MPTFKEILRLPRTPDEDRVLLFDGHSLVLDEVEHYRLKEHHRILGLQGGCHQSLRIRRV